MYSGAREAWIGENDWVNDTTGKTTNKSKVHSIPQIFLIFLLLFLGGCSGKTVVTYIPPEKPEAACRQSEPSEDINLAADALRQHFADWQGTRYKLGGISHDGVDCSGFTQLTYREVFGIDLPRTVKEQLKTGARIAGTDLQPGDLLFFKVGRAQRHVGIYLQKNLFMHASQSRGVVISTLNNAYWRKRLWQAHRVQAEADLQRLSAGNTQQSPTADS